MNKTTFKRKNGIKFNNKISFSAGAFIFLAVSFLGWAGETAGCLIVEKSFNDRGFLFLPFCFIYGTTVFIMFFLFGTPFKGIFYSLSEKIFTGKTASRLLSFLLYFFAAAAVPTLAEFAVSLFFDKLFAVRLWYYEGYPMNLNGYICLPFSLLWGFLITLAMAFVWEPVRTCTEKIRPDILRRINIVLWSAVAADFLANLIFLAATGSNYVLCGLFN